MPSPVVGSSAPTDPKPTAPKSRRGSPSPTSANSAAPKRSPKASPTPPQGSQPKEMTIPINGIEYVMTVYVDGKPLSITDAATMKKVQDLANQLINDITSKNEEIFEDKTVTAINDKGIFAGKELIHPFKPSNSIWEQLKKEVLTLNLPSSTPKVEVKLTPKPASTSAEGSSSQDSEVEKDQSSGKPLTPAEELELEKLLAKGSQRDSVLGV
ncbi:MAG: hypothetical protein H7A39_05380 [Chlamydiales bacterium]|nr:hypothetical protein [Chlamydiales bacterium]